MTGALDLLLEQVREPEPADELFVRRVMAGVRPGTTRRARLFTLRHPVIATVAAAALVTGGAVAAVVGTNPHHKTETSPPRLSAPAAVTARKAPPAAVPVAPRPAATVKAPAPAKVVQKARGYLTEHTAWAFDAKTGLRLTTESYTTDFTVGKAQRVALTLENTGAKPVSVSGASDCALQVMAVPAGGDVGAVYNDPRAYSGQFEWVCAGSDANPRIGGLSETFVLEPGDRRTADGFVDLKQAGKWNVFGMCRCSYRTVDDPSASPKSDALVDLFSRALPNDVLPADKAEGKDLATPPIAVRAR
jgi:hypothetical protein